MRFRNRSDAGQRLADRLEHLRGKDAVILGLPRGGVPVAAEVARALAAPLDIILVRKLGVPAQPELGMGAIGESDARVINPDVVRYAQVSEAQMAEVERRERAELQRRAQRFRGGAPHEPLAGRIAVIVDDGIATGSTARAARSSAITSSSEVCAKSSYHSPIARNRAGISRQITSSASPRMPTSAPGGATGTASSTLAAPIARATWHAARAVEPVAIPSSTMTAIRPASGSWGAPPRNR